MCSTVAKGYLCKKKRQCPWEPYLTLGVHSMQLILIDGVDLTVTHHRFNQRHDPFRHLAVQRVIAAERHDAVASQRVLDLKIGRAHFDERFRVIAACDDATIVVTQYHDGRAGQVRSEDTLATGVEAVAIRERENWQGRVEVDLNAHGRARCS